MKKENKKAKAIRKATEYLEQLTVKKLRPDGDDWFSSADYAEATSQSESGARKKLNSLFAAGKLEETRLSGRRFYRPR